MPDVRYLPVKQVRDPAPVAVSDKVEPRQRVYNMTSVSNEGQTRVAVPTTFLPMKSILK